MVSVPSGSELARMMPIRPAVPQRASLAQDDITGALVIEGRWVAGVAAVPGLVRG